jgi:hypothetical protein
MSNVRTFSVSSSENYVLARFLVSEEAPRERKPSENLYAPNLVQSLLSKNPSKAPKLDVPPPVQFRDPPTGPATLEQCREATKPSPDRPVVNGDQLIGSSDANRIRCRTFYSSLKST